MSDLTSRVFEHLDTTSPMEVDKIVAYTQHILRGDALKKYKVVLVERDKPAKDLAGDSWNLSYLKELSIYD